MSQEAGLQKGRTTAREAYTLKEFYEAKRISRTKTWEEIRSGSLKCYRVGRRVLISVEAAQSWQNAKEASGTDAGPTAVKPKKSPRLQK